MGFEMMIARRLKLSGEGRRPSAAVVIAVAGVALSLTVMLLSLGVVLGFKSAIREKVTGFDAHITVHPASAWATEETPLFLRESPELDRLIAQTPGLSGAEPLVEQSAMLKTDSAFQALVLHGVPVGGRSWRFVNENLREGAMPDNDGDIAVSAITARMLSLQPGDRIFAYFFIDGAVKARRVTVSGIYDTSFGDYDRNLAFVPVGFARSVAGASSEDASRVRIWLDDTDDIDEAARVLHSDMSEASALGHLEGAYTISTVLQTGILYFNWLDLLDTNVVVILTLMMVVAAFTLVSSLFIIILERVNMIGLLKALGATNGSITRIFVYLGQGVVAKGIALGALLGVGLLFVQWRWRLLPLDPEAYYLDYVPVEFNLALMGAVCVGVFVISWAVLLIPGRLIAGIDPASTMRYE